MRSWELWVQQAEHDAEVASFLAGGSYWSDAAVLAFEAIETAINGLIAASMTYGQMENFTYGELEEVLDPKHPLPTHDLHRVMGLRKWNFPEDLVARVVALRSHDRRLDLRYPRRRDQVQVPFELADEAEARTALQVMRDVLEYVRAEAR